MDNRSDNYNQIIDELVQLSRSCVDAECIRDGNVIGDFADSGIIDLLAKLSDNERALLAAFVSSVFRSGIYSVLDTLEWHSRSGNISILFDGQNHAETDSEGLQNDFLSRCNKWEWSDQY